MTHGIKRLLKKRRQEVKGEGTLIWLQDQTRIDKSRLSNIISCGYKATDDELERIAKALEVTVEQLEYNKYKYR